jgi:hypothetical protein
LRFFKGNILLILLIKFLLIAIFFIIPGKAEAATVAKPFVDKLIRLAEVASQSEAYTSVVEELQKCLEIQKASFPADSRS